MSGFSDVDRAADPERLLRSLEDSAGGLAAMKHYMAATHRRASSSLPVLDVGCGAGHDLEVLAAMGVPSIGIDSSAFMTAAAARRVSAPVAQADGTALPFRAQAFGGAWVERVLMHVADPQALIAEVVGCVAGGGVITVFEPDWSSLRVNGEAVPVEWSTTVRHPRAGLEAGELLRAAGCVIEDRVEERSRWDEATFGRVVGRFDRSVAAGRVQRDEVDRWLSRECSAEAQLSAEMVKVLWVATAPS